MAEAYLWLKAAHVISVIAWMAGLLYLPRLYVYHVDAPAGSVQSETFKVMERRLLKAIMTPAMAASWFFGLAIVAAGAVDWHAGWFYLKILLVLVMSAFHGLLARWRRDFEADRNTRSARFYRVANEAPTVLMIAIVGLVIIKPI